MRSICITLLVVFYTTVRPETPSLLVSQGTRGRVFACTQCPKDQPTGGLLHLASRIREAQREDADLVLLDAGEAFTGGDLLPDDLSVVTQAYEKLGYQAMNISHRDFRYGAPWLLDLLGKSNLPVVSANLLFEDSGDLMFPPLRNLSSGEKSLWVIGLTEPPAGRTFLPHLQEQLQGIGFLELKQALVTQLDTIKGSENVVILYAGKGKGLGEVLTVLNSFSHHRYFIVSSEPMPVDTPKEIHFIQTDPSGNRMVWFGESGKRETRFLEGGSDTSQDPEVLQLLDEQNIPLPDQVSIRESTPLAAPSIDELELKDGFQDESVLSVLNRGLAMQVYGQQLRSEVAGEPAPAGSLWFVVDVEIENQQAIDLLLELDYPEQILIGPLNRQLYLVSNGRTVHSVHPLSTRVDKPLINRFTLSQNGSRLRGKVVFQVPDSGIQSLSLRYYHDSFPGLIVPLIGSESTTESMEGALVSRKEDNWLELGVFGVEKADVYRGVEALPDMEWVILDIRGKGLRPDILDGLAFDPKADTSDNVEILRRADYLKASELMQLVADQGDAYTFNSELSTLEPHPVFLADAVVGGQVVFEMPKDAQDLHLYAGFPTLKWEGETYNPKGFTLSVQGVEPDPLEPIAVIEDDPLPLHIEKFEWVAETHLLSVWVSIRNTSEVGGMYKAASRADLRLPGGVKAERLPPQLRGGIELPEEIWIPADSQPRRFSYRFKVPAEPESVTFTYGGVEKYGEVPFSLETFETGEVVERTDDKNIDSRSFSADTETGLTPQPFKETGELLDFTKLSWAEPKPAEGSAKSRVVQPPDGGMELEQSLVTPAYRFQVPRAYLLSDYYGVSPDEGMAFLAFELSIESVDSEQTTFVHTNNSFHGLVNGSRLVAPENFYNTAPRLPRRFIFSGDASSNFLIFQVPKENVRSFACVYVDPTYGAFSLPILGDPTESADVVGELQSNQVAEFGVYGFEIHADFLKKSSGDAQWLVVDIRGKSLIEQSLPGGQDVKKLLSWHGWKDRVQLIINGKKSIPVEKTLTTFYDKSYLIPGQMTGGLFAFQVTPEDLEQASSIQVQIGFLPKHDSENVLIHPETLYVPLKGEAPTLTPSTNPLFESQDLWSTIRVLSMSQPDLIDERNPPRGSSWLQLQFEVEGTADQGVSFAPSEYLDLISSAGKFIPIHSNSKTGPDSPPNGLAESWIPRGGFRTFTLNWQVKDENMPVRFRLRGLKEYTAFDLFPQASSLERNPYQSEFIAENGLQVLYPHQEAKGISSVGLTAEQVNQAIDRGRDSLWKALRKSLEDSGTSRPKSYQYPMALALVHCEAHLKYPEFDESLRSLIERSQVDENNVYENAILAMIIDSYGDGTFKPKLRQVAHYLVESQGAGGTWTYTAPVPEHFFEEPQVNPAASGEVLQVSGGQSINESAVSEDAIVRTQLWERGRDGDNSCSQFAVLGLWSASRWGIEIPRETWERTLAAFANRQSIPYSPSSFGGYAYHRRGNAYGSMTCAGMCAYAITHYQLFPEEEAAYHMRIRNALGWLAQNFTVVENPESEKYNYYYLYSIERVGQILGTDFIGEHEWYAQGAKQLVHAQKEDGSWPSGPSETESDLTSSYALLFLTRATPELNPEAAKEPTGPGILATGVRRPEIQNRIYLILDASGSMRSEIAGEMKFDTARNAIKDVLRKVPDDTQVALRVYGHRTRAIHIDANEDTALEIPWGPLDREVVNSKLDALRPMGKTPMALSLEEAQSEIRSGGRGKTLLILLTDGGEDNRETDPVKAASAYADKANVDFYVVGFDINNPRWSKQLRDMADAGKGRYRPVQESTALAGELSAIVYPPVPTFDIVNSEDAIVASGTFGDKELFLAPGSYQLVTSNGDRTIDFQIRAEGRTRITYDLTQVVDAPTPRKDDPTPSMPSFCTHCGHKLNPEAKFCTRCGNKI